MGTASPVSCPPWFTSNNLTDTEIYIGLKKLAVMLGDGHTGISSQGVAGITKLPIDLYSFIEGLVVVRQHGGGSSMIGHRVLGFGSTSTKEAKHAATALVSRDNPMSLESGLPGVLVTGPYLADIGAANHDGSVTLRMEARDGRQSKPSAFPSLHLSACSG